MGTLYLGPFHEEIDAYRHEGWAARVFPDGTETGEWGGAHGWTGHVGYRARCECGWAGSTVYSVPEPDPKESAAAEEEWFRDHITPLVEQARRTAWPQWQKTIATRAGVVCRYIEAGRYGDAISLMVALREDLDRRLRTVSELAETGRGGDRP